MADLRKEELFPADAFGLFYLLVGWTCLGLAFALVDLLIALPIPKDENGMIEI